MLNNLMLAAYCEEVYRRGWVYWYGTVGYKCTMDLYKRKAKQYPSHYTASRESGYLADIKAGKTCADCVGMIKSFFWSGGDIDGEGRYQSNSCPDASADGLFALCREKGHIDTIPDVPGLVVHKSGHIGVYVGGGFVVEMNGFVNDCLRRHVEGGPWTEWGYLPESMLAYVEDGEAPAELALGDRMLAKGDRGADVRALQEALLELGYSLPKYGADGDFGRETQAAVKLFQADRGLESTGVFDAAAFEALRAAPESDGDDPGDGAGEPEYVLILRGGGEALRKLRELYGGVLAAVADV